MASQDTFVHVWKIGNNAFVFCGGVKVPATYWTNRHDYESDLNDVLQLLDAQPALAVESLSWPTYGSQARTVQRMTEKKLIAAGFCILSSRDRATVVVPEKKQPVYAIDSWGKERWFPSVRCAARHLGVSPSLVTLKAQDPHNNQVRYDRV